MTILQLKKVKLLLLLLLFYFIMPDPKSNSSSIGPLLPSDQHRNRTESPRVQNPDIFVGSYEKMHT